MQSPNWKTLSLPLLLLAIGAGTLACSSRSADISGTGVKALVNGEVESVGSLVVNGTRYKTDANSEILIDGASASAEELELGMIVEIELPADDLGRDDALAERVQFRSQALGPIDRIDLGNGVIEVLGQTVLVDDLSRVRNSQRQALDLSALQVGDPVRVSGYRQEDGSVRATLISLRAAPVNDIRLQGIVMNIDRGNQQFRLGAAVVDFSRIEAFTIGNGEAVAVRGLRTASNRVEATQIETLQTDTPPQRPASLHGAIGRLGAAEQCPDRVFELSGRSVRVGPQTRYTGGSCASLQTNLQVIATGRFDTAGRLNADDLRLLPRPDSVLRVQVESLSRDNDRVCQLQVLGDLSISVGRDTRLDRPETDQRSPQCNDFDQGSLIQVVGEFRPDGGGVVAAQLTRAPADAPQLLSGPLQSLDRNSRQFQLLDTTVQITDRSRFAAGSEQDFFDQSAVGGPVVVEGQWDGRLFQASFVGTRAARNVDRPGDRP